MVHEPHVSPTEQGGIQQKGGVYKPVTSSRATCESESYWDDGARPLLIEVARDTEQRLREKLVSLESAGREGAQKLRHEQELSLIKRQRPEK